MKIEKLELFKVAPRWLFLKMTTDDGLTGWGEPVCEGKADSVAAAVRELGAQLIGRAFGGQALLNCAHAYQQHTSWHRQRPLCGQGKEA